MEEQTESKVSNLPLPGKAAAKVVDVKTDDTKTNQNISLNGKTWPDIFQDFFDTPPTKSFLRLYLLCWILWNRSLILFILFSDKDMMHKLDFHIWSYYVTGSFHNNQLYVYANMYLMPLFLYGIIWYIVFKKISPAGWNTTFFRNLVWKVPESEKNAFSLYNWQHSKHIEDQKKRAQAEREVVLKEKVLQEDRMRIEENKLDIYSDIEKKMKKYFKDEKLDHFYNEFMDFTKNESYIYFGNLYREKYYKTSSKHGFSLKSFLGGADKQGYLLLMYVLANRGYIIDGENLKADPDFFLGDNLEEIGSQTFRFSEAGRVIIRAASKYEEIKK